MATITRNSALVRDLERTIGGECALYERYIKLLDQERVAMRSFRDDKVRTLTEKRALLLQDMQQANLKRMALMQRFPAYEGKKLSQLIKEHCHPQDQRRLTPAVERLKLLVANSRRRGFEISQLVKFGLGIVNGTMSLIFSATQNVVKSYGRSGKLEETTHPAGSRKQRVLKEV